MMCTWLPRPIINKTPATSGPTRQYQNRVKIIKKKIDFLRTDPDADDKKGDEETSEGQDESGETSGGTSEEASGKAAPK